jgi:hypothetical protein
MELSYISPVRKQCLIKKNQIECQVKLDPALHAMVKQVKSLTDQEFDSMMAEGNKHPSAEDEKNARGFARKVLD